MIELRQWSPHWARHDLFFRHMIDLGVINVDCVTGIVMRCQLPRYGRFRRLRTPRRVGVPTGDGYLRVSVTIEGTIRTTGTHRLVWIAAGRPITPWLEINHANGNRMDNRIDNLEVMTAGDNQRHCYQVLGRSVAGELNGHHKLTTAQVASIRERYARGGESHRKLASEFQVCDSTIGSILKGRNWCKARGKQ